MKIVSYNINDSKLWKIERLLGLGADVLVVPEITCLEDAKLPWNRGDWFLIRSDKIYNQTIEIAPNRYHLRIRNLGLCLEKVVYLQPN